jgi:ubiquinone/menaquinone biosynthesis C-methylase UbiE
MADEPGVHPIARAFDSVGPQYERGRPDYPPEAVRRLAELLGLGPDRTVIELGSGTGKFTRALLPTGVRVIPVEPSEGMRAVFRARLPNLVPLDGTAEAIPLSDGVADAVVVAQAFHWFRQPAALDEIARVLRPSGGLGLVWNRRDESEPWAAEFGQILEAYDEGDVPRTRQEAWKAAMASHPMFSPLESFVLSWCQDGDAATFVDRALSVSYVASRSPEVRATVAAKVRALLSEHPDTRGRDRVQMPYRTEVYWARRRGEPSSDRHSRTAGSRSTSHSTSGNGNGFRTGTAPPVTGKRTGRTVPGEVGTRRWTGGSGVEEGSGMCGL